MSEGQFGRIKTPLVLACGFAIILLFYKTKFKVVQVQFMEYPEMKDFFSNETTKRNSSNTSLNEVYSVQSNTLR